MVIRIDIIITEWFEHDIEPYRDAIGEGVYREYLKLNHKEDE